jgi:hypothetical protein
MMLANVLIFAGIVLMPSLGFSRDEPAPDMEMLEFLGSFETAGGKPVDPLAFADYAAKEHKKEQSDAAFKGQNRNRKPKKQEQKDHNDEK